MCGGWACASYSLACNNPELSTLRFTGRDFIPTPCGPHDKCFAKDTSCSRGNSMRPHNILVKLTPCLEESDATKKAKEKWKTAYDKVKSSPAPATSK